MNSKIVHFVTIQPAAGPVLIGGMDLSNQLGQTFQRYKEGKGLNDFELRIHFPAADALHELLADWYISSYLEVSALQIMSSLDRRSSIMPKNYFYSILGVLTQQTILAGARLNSGGAVGKLDESVRTKK